MLRLGTLDFAGGPPAQGAIRELVARALGHHVSERVVNCNANFAIEQLCGALLADAPRGALGCVERLLDCGVSVEALYDTYIPRAAARLGELWLRDEIGFTAVTLGMARLTEVFRKLSPSFLRSAPARPQPAPHGRRALFALAPGETHALGVVIAADYFQRAGWTVQVELRADAAGLERIVRAQPFDLIGLSAGGRRMIPEIRRTVTRLRRAARPSARFALGGALARIEPGAAELTGVDLAVGAASDAIERLEPLDRATALGTAASCHGSAIGRERE